MPSPTVIPFQGRLTSQQGAPYTEGQYTLTFSLYNEGVGGTTVWTERHEKVGVVNGTINVFLGSIQPLTNMSFATPKYLGITIDADGNPLTADPEMVPRQMIIPAFWAKNAEKLAGSDWSPLLVSGNDPAAGQLRGDKIGAGTIRLSSLHPDALAALSATLVQSPAGLLAGEAIENRKAIAYVADAAGTRLLLASASTTTRSSFFGFAVASAASGQVVGSHQYGPLDGFSGLKPGRSYYLDLTMGEITSDFPTGIQVYVGHALSASTLFVDPIGVSKSWGYAGNNYGNGSDGVLSTDQNVSFPVAIDGEVVVKQFQSLTINAGHTVTTENRCRGLVLYVDGDATINGVLTMTARGAFKNPALADSILPTGIRLVRRRSGATGAISLTRSELGGLGLGGVGATWRDIEGRQAELNQDRVVVVIEREGAGGGGRVGGQAAGANGSSGVNFARTGGGGGGSAAAGAGGGAGAAGTCYSGGTGGGGGWEGTGLDGEAFGGRGGNGIGIYSGAGGGAGNPGGTPENGFNNSGTGGLLVLFVRGNLTVGAQGLISADGVRGAGGIWAGGSSGGGRVIALYGGTLSGRERIQARGGASTPNGDGTVTRGGAGGDGDTTVDKIDP